ncbi:MULTISPECIES: hypothetical protein [Pseudomonas syringae group]|uniref:hypothetical protein n=1 Tax=Pseudomonas syringae group TaxID=136849 RepID=UPI000F018CE0|nr:MULTISPECIES: hypothetical protein [Pseudomonas syringae group]MCF5652675.1 hypothetical protein [Pseudomonas syringae]
MDGKVVTEFTISYDAKGALAHHQIKAKDLGSAILGMDDLITKSAKIVSNGSSEADLSVVAPAKEGSLEIIYSIFADPLTAITVLKSIGIIGGTAVASTASAIGIIDRIKDKKIDKVVINARKKTAIITVDGKEIETTSDVAQLVSSKEIRQALHKVIQGPLQGKENPRVSFKAEGKVTTLAEDKIANFKPIKSDLTEKVNIDTFRKKIQFTKLNFKGKRGWSIASRDGFEASVSIQDEEFMLKVAENEEAFLKDKLYMVNIEKKEIIDLSGTRTTYAIVKVFGEAV